jgi:hypothetical protein
VFLRTPRIDDSITEASHRQYAIVSMPKHHRAVAVLPVPNTCVVAPALIYGQKITDEKRRVAIVRSVRGTFSNLPVGDELLLYHRAQLGYVFVRIAD